MGPHGGISRVRPGVRLAAAAALFALLSSACSAFDYLAPPINVLVDRRGEAVDGRVDPETLEDMPAVFDAYFPSSVQIHAGDTIIFEPEFTGEPHTVTFGTLVDDAVEKLSEFTPETPLEEIEALPEMQALPTLFPRDPGGGGPLQVNASAAEPCYLQDDRPPTSAQGGARACPERAQPEFTGEETFYSSGWLKQDERFRVTFSEDLEPGTYGFMCLVHRSAMTGTVEVLPEERAVPAKRDVLREADEALDRLKAGLEPVADEVASATPESAVAGAGEPWRGSAQLAAFFPERVRVEAGETVSWTVSGMHTITLQPDVIPGELLEEAGEGIALNPEVVRPSEGAPLLPHRSLAYPPAAGGEPVALSATYDGEGTFNSGLLWSIPPVGVTYDVTFTRPGTYELRCLVHPDMRAVVEVEG